MCIDVPGLAAQVRCLYEQTPENGILESSDAVINGEQIMSGESA
jgi:hypothetical protein